MGISTNVSKSRSSHHTVADPGFPVGGGPEPLRGADLRCEHFLAKTYVKTKELDPVGGARRRRPLDPPMAVQTTPLSAPT